MDYQLLEKAAAFLKEQWPAAKPQCGLILGSGWSQVAETFTVLGELDYSEIPGLGAASVAGHAGRLLWGEKAGIETLIFQGRHHFYEGVGWTAVALPVYCLKKLGATKVLITNAAGGIRNAFKAGDLMIIEDHLNAMGDHPLIGEHNEIWGPRFPDQTYLYRKSLRNVMTEAAKAAGIPIHTGVYLSTSGPTYETPAEIRYYRTIGADAVGMSTVPEAMLANAAGLEVCGLSCITNMAAGILDQPLNHEEVTAATAAAMPNMTKLISTFWEQMSHV